MYKFADKEHTLVNNLDTKESGLYPGCHQWQAYEDWLTAGGITEAYDTRTPEEILADDKRLTQEKHKLDCESHILSKYPLTVQSSMGLGIYPVELKTTMVNFIAACIEEENRVFDLVETVVALEGLSMIIPSWPEV